MLDKNLLHALKSKVKYELLYPTVPLGSFDKHTGTMLKWYGAYFKKYPDAQEVNIDNLETLIRLNGKLNAEQLALTNRLLDVIRQPVDMVAVDATIAQLEELRFSEQMRVLIQKYDDGVELDLRWEAQQLAEQSKKRSATQDSGTWDDTSIVEILTTVMSDDAGFSWDFLASEFDTNLRPALTGDNIALAAPTDMGKTGLLCRWAVNWAKQYNVKLQHGLVDRFRPLLILINEGSTKVVNTRIYQTALELPREKLMTLAIGDKTEGKTTLQDAYNAILGRSDAIRLVSIHGMSIAQVRRIIEKHDPFCVMTDMTGRIRASDGVGRNDTAQLEEVWNCMRESTEILDFIHVGTIQISNEGMNMLYPPLTAIQDSKVGIQTTWDLGLFMGAYLNPVQEVMNLRGISTPKNKLVRDGEQFTKYVKSEVNVQWGKNIWRNDL